MVVCEEQSPRPAEEKDPRKCVVVRNMLSNDVSEMVKETKEILEEIVLIKNRLDLIENRICMRP